MPVPPATNSWAAFVSFATAMGLLLFGDRQAKAHLGYSVRPQRSDSVIPARFFETNNGYHMRPLVFTINYRSTACAVGSHDPYVLFIVRSATSHFERRDAIRMTWARWTSVGGSLTAKFVFLLGVPHRDQIQQSRIVEESEKYEDVVQADFHDTYANLTLKDTAAFQWAATHCPGATFVAVASDEVFVDVNRLVLLHLNSVTAAVREVSFCYLFPCCTHVYTESESKYRVQNGRYEGRAYPAYCSGTLYVVPAAIMHELYAAALDTPAFMPDDAWIGVLLEKLGVGTRDTHAAFVGIDRKDLRATSDRSNGGEPAVAGHFVESVNRVESESSIVVAVLDYAYPHDVHDKMIEIWHALSRVKQQGREQQHRRQQPPPDGGEDDREPSSEQLLVLSGASLVVISLCCYLLVRRRCHRLCKT